MTNMENIIENLGISRKATKNRLITAETKLLTREVGKQAQKITQLLIKLETMQIQTTNLEDRS